MLSEWLAASVRQPLIFRIEIWPDAIRAQNSMAAVSAEGSTVCVLIRRLNSSCRRSIALVAVTEVKGGLVSPTALAVMDDGRVVVTQEFPGIVTVANVAP